MSGSIAVVDPFELPEWLGTSAVSWHSTSPVDGGPSVSGVFRTDDGRCQDLDLLAVDAAFPVPVCPDAERRLAHRSWQYGEVILLDIDGRIVAGVPGRQFDANLACETLRRVARSVAADTGRYSVWITL
jgi:hypothetical protein